MSDFIPAFILVAMTIDGLYQHIGFADAVILAVIPFALFLEIRRK